MFDVDIDFADREEALAVLKHIRATRTDKDGKLVPHNTGLYLQPIPYNPATNLANIDYEEATKRGYFKLDFLNVGIYKGVKDEAHLLRLMNTEPIWDLLEQDDFVNMLFHINGYGNILREMKPRSVEQLAAVLGMIRPAKKHLIGKSWPEVMADIWIKPENAEAGYFFKKAHSISYAMVIVVQMNLICEQALNESS